jgi:hypothetical protein
MPAVTPTGTIFDGCYCFAQNNPQQFSFEKPSYYMHHKQKVFENKVLRKIFWPKEMKQLRLSILSLIL